MNLPVCLEDTEVLQSSKPNLEKLYENVPKIERHFRILIQNAFIASTRRVTATLAKNALERYDEFITRYPEIEQRVPNHQIASYLGITPQSLSRFDLRHGLVKLKALNLMDSLSSLPPGFLICYPGIILLFIVGDCTSPLHN